MKPIYIDLHIHTSENPNEPNTNYDVDILLCKVKEFSKNATFMLSLTDHNMINQKAYMDLISKTDNVLLGVELHIRNYLGVPPYHCHIFFNVPALNEIIISDINDILNNLYPDKIVTDETEDIPTIEEIAKSFDSYDFILLPHGGQSHRTFDKSIPRNGGVKFDTSLERSIYYNQFDGFTARSNDGLEETQQYFRRLGIYEFVNLITCSDNYDPVNYPNAKARDAGPFLPTWMYATPSFDGLRLSLSEGSRFSYSLDIPEDWAEYISKVTLDNEKISIDVSLTPGLNVVIGGSSSGKTLFVDSIYRKLCNDFTDSNYLGFKVDELAVVNPSGIIPHYINQNFIINILSNEDKDINDIDIIEKVFPIDQAIDEKINQALAHLKSDLSELIYSVKQIESIEKDLIRIPVFTRLITKEKIRENIFNKLLPIDELIETYSLSEPQYNEYISVLDKIDHFITNNPLLENATRQIDEIKKVLSNALLISNLESDVRDILIKCKNNLDQELLAINHEAHSKIQNKENLFRLISQYILFLKSFKKALLRISLYDISCETKKIEVEGHRLSIQNSFVLNKEVILSAFNKYLKNTNSICAFEDITPQSLFEDKFSKRQPKVEDYDDFKLKVYAEFEKINKKNYNIETNTGKQFRDISPGWKSAVLLDLILGYKRDLAPLIIDQPEDNLATNYINSGLIKSIKRIKASKQIILVSHNATIPMLGDAQSVILCKNDEGKIIIKSSPLEGRIDGKTMVDYIAEITDGGKPSIKKRVKKYNLKSFREEL